MPSGVAICLTCSRLAGGPKPRLELVIKAGPCALIQSSAPETVCNNPLPAPVTTSPIAPPAFCSIEGSGGAAGVFTGFHADVSPFGTTVPPAIIAPSIPSAKQYLLALHVTHPYRQ